VRVDASSGPDDALTALTGGNPGVALVSGLDRYTIEDFRVLDQNRSRLGHPTAAVLLLDQPAFERRMARRWGWGGVLLALGASTKRSRDDFRPRSPLSTPHFRPARAWRAPGGTPRRWRCRPGRRPWRARSRARGGPRRAPPAS